MRNFLVQPLSSRSTPAKAQHVRVDPVFVGEHQARGVEQLLELFPGARLRAAAGPSCTDDSRGFFEAEPLGAAKFPHRPDPGCDATLGKLGLQRVQGQVRHAVLGHDLLVV